VADSTHLQIGSLIFPEIDQSDLTGPQGRHALATTDTASTARLTRDVDEGCGAASVSH
jgi:hypothetical protein